MYFCTKAICSSPKLLPFTFNPFKTFANVVFLCNLFCKTKISVWIVSYTAGQMMKCTHCWRKGAGFNRSHSYNFLQGMKGVSQATTVPRTPCVHNTDIKTKMSNNCQKLGDKSSSRLMLMQLSLGVRSYL